MSKPAASAPLSPAAASVDLNDVQGLLRFGYKHQTEACFLLLRIRDAAAARTWLAAAPVTSAATREPPPEAALQIALTAEGLRALGVPDAVVDAFSPEFTAGMSGDASRSRRLGDVGANDPAHWRWGAADRVPHLLLMLYALPGRLGAYRQAVCPDTEPAFDCIAVLPTTDFGNTEPFGFADGISQPLLDWQRQRPARDAEQAAFDNLACLGEFLLGYPNEYGGVTDRPLIERARDPHALLATAEDAPAFGDLGRNGSYLVMRHLQQDVAGFWQHLDRQAGGDAAARLALAETMVGRRIDGEPLIPAGAGVPRHIAGIGAVDAGAAAEQRRLNGFGYRGDPDGLRCPLGAHIRRANPRTADLPEGAPGLVSWAMRTLGFDADALKRDKVASTRFHRLLRRGREYGVPMTIDEALAARPADDADANDAASGDRRATESGIYFVSLGASIARQFEFVQGAWLMNGKFDGLPDESDPLLGHRAPTPDGRPADGFSMPQPSGPDRRIEGLPRFVTVRGGAYFFLPSLRALRYIASLPETP